MLQGVEQAARRIAPGFPRFSTCWVDGAGHPSFGETNVYPDGRIELVLRAELAAGAALETIVEHELGHVHDAGRGAVTSEASADAFATRLREERWKTRMRNSAPPDRREELIREGRALADRAARAGRQHFTPAERVRTAGILRELEGRPIEKAAASLPARCPACGTLTLVSADGAFARCFAGCGKSFGAET